MADCSGNCRLVDAVSRGSPLEPRDRDALVPVLASFVTALQAVLATLHDSELVPTHPAGLVSGGGEAVISFAFSSAELVTISGSLRDVCIGLAELAHPDMRASNTTDASYKETWDHCFKVSNTHSNDTTQQLFNSCVCSYMNVVIMSTLETDMKTRIKH